MAGLAAAGGPSVDLKAEVNRLQMELMLASSRLAAAEQQSKIDGRALETAPSLDAPAPYPQELDSLDEHDATMQAVEEKLKSTVRGHGGLAAMADKAWAVGMDVLGDAFHLAQRFADYLIQQAIATAKKLNEAGNDEARKIDLISEFHEDTKVYIKTLERQKRKGSNAPEGSSAPEGVFAAGAASPLNAASPPAAAGSAMNSTRSPGAAESPSHQGSLLAAATPRSLAHVSSPQAALQAAEQLPQQLPAQAVAHPQQPPTAQVEDWHPPPEGRWRGHMSGRALARARGPRDLPFYVDVDWGSAFDGDGGPAPEAAAQAAAQQLSPRARLQEERNRRVEFEQLVEHEWQPSPRGRSFAGDGGATGGSDATERFLQGVPRWYKVEDEHGNIIEITRHFDENAIAPALDPHVLKNVIAVAPSAKAILEAVAKNPLTDTDPLKVRLWASKNHEIYKASAADISGIPLGLFMFSDRIVRDLCDTQSAFRLLTDSTFPDGGGRLVYANPKAMPGDGALELAAAYGQGPPGPAIGRHTANFKPHLEELELTPLVMLAARELVTQFELIRAASRYHVTCRKGVRYIVRTQKSRFDAVMVAAAASVFSSVLKAAILERCRHVTAFNSLSFDELRSTLIGLQAHVAVVRSQGALYGLHGHSDETAADRAGAPKTGARHLLAALSEAPPHKVLNEQALMASLADRLEAMVDKRLAFAEAQTLKRQHVGRIAASILGPLSEAPGSFGDAARALQGAGGPATETAAAAAAPFSSPRHTGLQTPLRPLGNGSGRSSGRSSGASSRAGSPDPKRDPTICRYDIKEGPCYNFLELGYCTNGRGQQLQHPFFAGCDPGKKAALINSYREHCTASGKPFTVHASVATET